MDESVADLMARLQQEQEEQDAELQRSQAAQQNQISSADQSTENQYGLGKGINNGLSSFRTGKNLSGLFSSTPAITGASGVSAGGGGAALGSTEGMAGSWGAVSSGGAGSGAAAGGSSLTSGLAAAGPWAAIAAAAIGQHQWARHKGLHDNQDAITGQALAKDTDGYYADKVDNVLPGIGNDMRVGADLGAGRVGPAFTAWKKNPLGLLGGIFGLGKKSDD